MATADVFDERYCGAHLYAQLGPAAANGGTACAGSANAGPGSIGAADLSE